MDIQSANSVLFEMFQESCEELYESLNCNIRVVELPEHDISDTPASCIDAGNDDFDLDIFIISPFSALAMSYPISDDVNKIDESALEDWLDELANRLLGLFKAKLLARASSLKTGLPQFMHGRDVLAKPEFDNQHRLFLDIDGEIVETRLILKYFGDNIDLSEIVVNDDSFSSGELEFF